MAQGQTKDGVSLGRVFVARVLKPMEHGLLVRFGQNWVGYIPADEIAEAFDGNPALVFKPGDSIRAMVVVVCDAGRRFVLSVKSAENIKSSSATVVSPDDDGLSDTPRPGETLSFDRIYRRYQKESQARLSLLRKNIESKKGDFK